jgi:signal transduction histidine kinase
LDIVWIHHDAVLRMLQSTTSVQCLECVKAGRNFLIESLSPFEMAHRGFQEAINTLHRLNELLEEEAKRIAHALHDETGQLLAAVHLALDCMVREVPGLGARPVKEIKELLDQIEAQLRSLSHELRPTILDDLGLFPALQFLAKRVSARTGACVAVEGATYGRLPPDVETALYRIVQEALTNATKHGSATRIEVVLQHKPGIVTCLVRDNGVGFDVDAARARTGARGLGLLGMTERLSALGGTLHIVSSIGCGTDLRMNIPLES